MTSSSACARAPSLLRLLRGGLASFRDPSSSSLPELESVLFVAGGTKRSKPPNIRAACMLQNQAKQGTRKCSSGTASGGKLSIDMIQSMRSIDLPEKKDRHHEPSDDPAAAGPTQQPKIPDDVEKIVEVPATPPATDFAPKRRLSESGTTMTTSSSCGHLTSLGGDGSGGAGTDAPALPAAPESPRPVVKRSNSLGHLTTFLLGRGDDDENNDIESSGNSDQQKHATTGLLQKLGLRRNTMEHHQTAISGDVLDMSGRGGDVNAMPPPAPSRKIKAAAKFHHRCTMEDSIHVQKRHNTVLDDEKHEENPHLKDYLKPKQFVHISKRESQDNLLHLETQYLRPKFKPMVVAEEESSDEENENDDLLPSASPVSDVDVDADTAASTDADEMDVERTEVHDEPVTAVAHKEFDPNEPLRSCVKKAWGQDTEARKPKKNVDFHEVTVREYGITLGGTYIAFCIHPFDIIPWALIECFCKDLRTGPHDLLGFYHVPQPRIIHRSSQRIVRPSYHIVLGLSRV
jgi:hypothetical protein